MNRRTVLTVAIAAIAGLLLGAGVGVFMASRAQPYYRAQIQLAMLPGPTVPAEQISNYWEALATGQAPRVAAEVLNQTRWKQDAATAAGVDAASITLDAGVVTDTTLIDVGVSAPSAAGAEKGATAVVAAATPLAQQVSGPFVLQTVQPAEGTATSLTTPSGQVIAIAALAGLAVGAGAGLLWSRRTPRRPRPQAQVPPYGPPGQRSMGPPAPPRGARQGQAPVPPAPRM